MLAIITALALAAAPVESAPSAKSRAQRPSLMLRSWAQLGAGVAGVTVGALAGFAGGCVIDSLGPRSFISIGPGCATSAALLALGLGIAGGPLGLWLGSEALGMNSRVDAIIAGYLLGGVLIIPGVMLINALGQARYDYPNYQPSSVPVDFLTTLVATVMCLGPFAGGIFAAEMTARWDEVDVKPTASVGPRGGSLGFALTF